MCISSEEKEEFIPLMKTKGLPERN